MSRQAQREAEGWSALLTNRDFLFTGKSQPYESSPAALGLSSCASQQSASNQQTANKSWVDFLHRVQFGKVFLQQIETRADETLASSV
jgi:hypothetical protein